jgi:hypothetical protein
MRVDMTPEDKAAARSEMSSSVHLRATGARAAGSAAARTLVACAVTIARHYADDWVVAKNLRWYGMVWRCFDESKWLES